MRRTRCGGSRSPWSAAEALCSFIDERRDELLGFVEALVATDSSVSPHADERGVVALLQERLPALGLGRGQVLALDLHRPNLALRQSGLEGGRSLLLNRHLGTSRLGTRSSTGALRL